MDAPGEWFAAELRRSLKGLQPPYAVTNREMLEFVDFTYLPWLGLSNSGRPPHVEDEPKRASAEELLCLQGLGRMVKGKEEEIASLALRGWGVPKTVTFDRKVRGERHPYHLQGYETLFWLEVGDDHRSRPTIEAKMRKRFQSAVQLVRRTRVRLVFAVLAPRWVQDAAGWAFEDLPGNVAVVMGGWKHFGELPALGWGRVMRD